MEKVGYPCWSTLNFCHHVPYVCTNVCVHLYLDIYICTANIGHIGPGRNISRESSSLWFQSDRPCILIFGNFTQSLKVHGNYIVILLAARFTVYYHSHFHPFFGSNTSLLWMSFASQGLRRARMCIRRSSWAPAEALGALPNSTVENLGEESISGYMNLLKWCKVRLVRRLFEFFFWGYVAQIHSLARDDGFWLDFRRMFRSL